jgi:EmrB/QacA subfamily drug resistance transporter
MPGSKSCWDKKIAETTNHSLTTANGRELTRILSSRFAPLRLGVRCSLVCLLDNQFLNQKSGDRSQLIAFIVAVAFFMENLDGTAIATALPQMALSFGVSPSHLSIGITAYLVTLAIFIPISGWIADRYGARSVFSTAIAVFTIASVFCGVSPGLIQFIFARILQGIGGAMMVPVGRLVVLRSTPKNQLIRAIATITWPGLIATVIGPPVGGFITTYFSWHWIFLINVPIGLAGIVLVRKFVANFRSEKRQPLDLPGFLLAAVCLSCLMYGVELLGREDANWSIAAVFLLLSLVFGWFTFRQERRTEWPIFNFSLLKTPTYSIPLLAGSLTIVAIGAAPFLLPLMFQVGFGMSPFESGLLVLVYAAGNLLMKTMTTRTLKRFGFRAVLLTNTPLIALFAIACGLLAGNTPVPVTVAVLLGAGLVRSLQFTGLNTLAFSDVPVEGMSSASMMYSTIQQLAFGIGIAFAAVALRFATMIRGGAHGYQASDFRIAFGLVAAVALLSLPPYWRLSRLAGVEVSGRRRAEEETPAMSSENMNRES